LAIHHHHPVGQLDEYLSQDTKELGYSAGPLN